jgi:hypothetical protein
MIDALILAGNNKLVWGLTMLMMNLGARYIAADMGASHEIILNNHIAKKLIVFSLFFVATRDIPISVLMTILYVIVIDGLLHDKSKYCIVPKALLTGEKDNSAVQNYTYNLAILNKQYT